MMSNAKKNNRGKRPPRRLAVQSTATSVDEGVAQTPLLPHEHDESPEPSTSLPEPVEVQAHTDVARGLVDTDRRQDAARIFDGAARRARKTTGR